MADYTNDPVWKAWAADVKANLVPMIHGSSITVAQVGGEADDQSVQQAVEIGFILLMGRPLIVMVEPGAKVPPGLARAADQIVERAPDDATTRLRLEAAMKAIDDADG